MTMTITEVRDWHRRREDEFRISGYNVGVKNHQQMADAIDAHLNIHPTRSGRVSNTVALGCLRVYRDARTTDLLAMRAALEHFVKGERHE